MIEHRTGDLLIQPDLTHLVHQANLYHTFGAGIALAIKKKYPEAYRADCLTTKGDKSKLGSWSVGKPASGPYVLNLYSQVGIGSKDRQTSYDALDTGLRSIELALRSTDEEVVLGMPHCLGCGLANGRWPVVQAIVSDVFRGSPVRVVICRLPERTA